MKRRFATMLVALLILAIAAVAILQPLSSEAQPISCSPGDPCAARSATDAAENPQAWQVEVVDPGGTVGLYSSLKLDNTGRPHISYAQSQPGKLKYATRTTAGWQIETLATAGVNGTALALDASGYPHIAYTTWSTDLLIGTLVYLYKDAGGWHSQTIATSDQWLIKYPSLVVGPDGYPRVSYGIQNPVGGGLRYAYKNAGGWHVETVYLHALVEGTSLALSSAASPRIAYHHDSTYKLEYAYRDPGGWHHEEVEETGAVGVVSLAIGSNDIPHIGYYNTITDHLKHAYKDGGGWHAENVDAGVDIGLDPSMAVNTGNYPRMSYYAGGAAGDLSYAAQDGSGWHVETIDSAAQVGMYSSLALDSQGNPFISYYDSTSGDLKLASNVATPVCNATPTPLPLYTGTPPASATLQPRVAHCMDDAYVRTDTGDLLLSFPYVRTGARQSGAIPYMTGFVFRDVRIPRGADIVSAKLVLQPWGYQSGVPVSVDIRGELRAQSSDFNPGNTLLHLRPRTVASVRWMLNSTVTQPIQSPDFAAVVEEIVSQPGWRPGNNLAIFLDAHGTTAQYVDWRAYEYSASQAAQLVVRYQQTNRRVYLPIVRRR